MGYQQYKSQLSIFQRKSYNTVLKGLLDVKESIKVFDSDVDSLNSIISSVQADNPALYYVNAFSLQTSLGATCIYPKYTKRKNDVIHTNELLSKSMEDIIYQVRGQDDWHTLLNLHDYLCTRITYSNCGDIAHTIIGPLIHGFAVCDGISKVFKHICDALDIDCCVVSGIAKSDYESANFEKHSWNKVKVAGYWTNVDVTFDLTIGSPVAIRHDYFCVSDESIITSHVEQPPLSRIVCDIDGMDYYSIGGLIMNTQRDFIDYVKRMCKQGISAFEVKLPQVKNVSQLEQKIMNNISFALSELNISKQVMIAFNKEMLVFLIKIN